MTRLTHRVVRWAAVLSVAGGALQVLAIASPELAHAAPTPRALSTAWYVTHETGNSWAQTRGCAQGHADASSGQSSEVVLDFGGQNGNGGTLEIDGQTNITYAQIESAAWAYAAQYIDCSSGSTVLNLQVGTNNSDVVTAGGGTNWAGVVGQVKSMISSHPNAGRAIITAASDMEPSYASSSATNAFVTAYSNAYESDIYNYGSADGCQQTTWTDTACNNGWDQHAVWAVSWGIAGTFVLPEIYVVAQPNQWTMISKYSATYKNGKIVFEGPLVGTGSALSATSAWNDLWNALNGNSATTQSNFGAFEQILTQT